MCQLTLARIVRQVSRTFDLNLLQNQGCRLVFQPSGSPDFFVQTSGPAITYDLRFPIR